MLQSNGWCQLPVPLWIFLSAPGVCGAAPRSGLPHHLAPKSLAAHQTIPSPESRTAGHWGRRGMKTDSTPTNTQSFISSHFNWDVFLCLSCRTDSDMSRDCDTSSKTWNNRTVFLISSFVFKHKRQLSSAAASELWIICSFSLFVIIVNWIYLLDLISCWLDKKKDVKTLDFDKPNAESTERGNNWQIT